MHRAELQVNEESTRNYARDTTYYGAGSRHVWPLAGFVRFLRFFRFAAIDTRAILARVQNQESGRGGG